MAELKCEVVKVTIKEHDNADTLEIAQIRGYQSIVRKGQYETGDLAVYIPEQSVVPEWVLRELNLWDAEKGKGKLAGKKGNRVKPIKLRGVFSQGLLLPLDYWEEGEKIQYSHEEFPVQEGDDVTEYLGVTKWEPPIPVQMAGEVVFLGGKTLKYDIENIKNYPHIAQALIDLQIPVQITEKLHGTWCCFGAYPNDIHDEIPYKQAIVTSKGLSGKGLAFKDNEANENNLYLKTFKALMPDRRTFFNQLASLSSEYAGPIFILGEILGKGVQDLQYGLDKPVFRVFDMYQGEPGQGGYFAANRIGPLLEDMDTSFETVPVLYTGPLTWEIVEKYTNGLDTLSESHTREGIVIRTLNENYTNEKIGRVILKSVSEAYLSRKGGTEFN